MKLYGKWAFAAGVVLFGIAFQNCARPFEALSELGSKEHQNNLSSNLSALPDTSEVINFGVHMGGVQNNQPHVEEYLFPNKARSPWYLAQWKKIRPLRPSTDLSLNNSPGHIFKLKNANSNESEFSAFRDPQGKVIYQIDSRQGHLTSVGGSNIFLSANLRAATSLDREVVFSFDSKLLRKDVSIKPEYQNQSEVLLLRDVSGFFIGGFPVFFDDGNPENRASLFIQFSLADTRNTKLFVLETQEVSLRI